MKTADLLFRLLPIFWGALSSSLMCSCSDSLSDTSTDGDFDGAPELEREFAEPADDDRISYNEESPDQEGGYIYYEFRPVAPASGRKANTTFWKGGGSGDGNTAIVDIALSAMGGGSGDGNTVITWDRMVVRIGGAVLVPVRVGQEQEYLAVMENSRPLTVYFDVLHEDYQRIRAFFPSREDYKELALLSFPGQEIDLARIALPFHAEGHLGDGREIVLDLDLGLLSFQAVDGGVFNWDAGARATWVAAFDLDRFDEALRRMGLLDETAGNIIIDALHNREQRETALAAVLESFSLHQDPDRDGALSDREREDEANDVGEAESDRQTDCAQCDDLNLCTFDVCTGSFCIQDPLTMEETNCDDSDLCTTGDICREGLCVGEPLDCSGHGVCGNGICECNTGFDGESCERCADGYINYPDCAPEVITRVPHWFKRDVCGRYHTTYEDGGQCYLQSTSDPGGVWDEALLVSSCAYSDLVVDRGAACSVHIRVHVVDPGELQYYHWDGAALSAPVTITDNAYCNSLALDETDQPHLFWSNSRPYHRSRNLDGTWNDTVDISAGAPSGWCPAATLDAQGVWRAVFYRSIFVPDPLAQLFESYSDDNGLTWKEGTKLFPNFESSGWFASEPWVFQAHGSSNRMILFASNKSGENNLWLTVTDGAGWSEPELWRPLDPDTPVTLKTGAFAPDDGSRAFFVFSERDDESSLYYQFRCLGGDTSIPEEFPSATGEPGYRFVTTWESEDPPRVFWKENGTQADWYMVEFEPPTSCGR
ncbi:MAG: hypothetical protein C4523_06455 [Myxococcales bacterium]|nr:MAG: hypothetical protein C4523_06455 [Myxococcales bacterium]